MRTTGVGGALAAAVGVVLAVLPASSHGILEREEGLLVSGKSLRTPISAWPKVGEWVCVTGISNRATDGSGPKRPALQLRNSSDISR